MSDYRKTELNNEVSKELMVENQFLTKIIEKLIDKNTCLQEQVHVNVENDDIDVIEKEKEINKMDIIKSAIVGVPALLSILFFCLSFSTSVYFIVASLLLTIVVLSIYFMNNFNYLTEK